MALTLPNGPLSTRRPDLVNYRIEGPAHLLLFEPFPRRVRAEFAGQTVLDTTRGMLLHESNLLPVLYAPRDDVRTDLLTPTDHTTHCPFKGDASYWSVVVDGQTAQNAVWGYPEPLPDALWLRDFVAVYWNAMDAWYDEDRRVEGHLRDPYTRVDAVPSSRHVRVLAGDDVIAESRNPVLLSETSLPNRFYLPISDVREGVLTESPTRTQCPYKGTASYFTLRTPSTEIADAAWTYPVPFDEVRAIAGHVCFLADGLVTFVDGAQID